MSPTRLIAGAALLMLSAGPLFANDSSYLPSKEFASRYETTSSNLSLPSTWYGQKKAWYEQKKNECFGADTLDRNNYTPSRVFKTC